MITWVDVVSLDAALAAVPVSEQDRILARVASRMDPGVWGDKLDEGATYLAGHLGALNRRGASGPAGPVISESMGPGSRGYAAPISVVGAEQYEATTWGRQYVALRDSLLETRLGHVS